MRACSWECMEMTRSGVPIQMRWHRKAPSSQMHLLVSAAALQGKLRFSCNMSSFKMYCSERFDITYSLYICFSRSTLLTGRPIHENGMYGLHQVCMFLKHIFSRRHHIIRDVYKACILF